MIDLGKVMWRDFEADVQSKELYIFGAGARGARIAEIVKAGGFDWNIKAFLDNNMAGKTVYGYKILSPEILLDKDPERYVVLISLHYPGAIVSQLEKLGAKHIYSYFYLTEGGRAFLKQDLSNNAEVDRLREILSDDKSIWVLDQIIEKRKKGYIDYSDISANGSEYFRDEFFKPKEDEVFIDGGAFDGDTIEEFYEWTSGVYKRIYSFEADPRMEAIIRNKLFKWHDVYLVGKGLWETKQTLSFVADNQIKSSHISFEADNNTSSIECISFEEEFGTDVPVSFIKLDIEGAEIPALYGMEHIIKKHKPRMALSIYHKPEDLWQIPLLIHEWVPEYKLYMRHFHQNYFGTNIYATV